MVNFREAGEFGDGATMGTRVAGLNELLERVKAATGPSMVLEAELYATIGGAPHTSLAGRRTVPLVRKGDPTSWPNYTASVDAALALLERVLPGWHLEILRTNYCAVEMWKPDEQGYFNSARDPIVRRIEGATLPLAIIAATLTALIARKDAQ